MSHNKIAQIPKDKTITYTRLIVDFYPQRKDPNRVCMIAGGNLIT